MQRVPHTNPIIEEAFQINQQRGRRMVRPAFRQFANKSYESAVVEAAARAGISKSRAKLFVSYLVEAIIERLMVGELIRIPRLLVMCIVPSAANKKFRVRFTADYPLRMRVRDEFYSPSAGCEAKFLRMCRTLRCCLPYYKKRGITFRGLFKFDRRAIARQSDDPTITLQTVDYGLNKG